MIISFKTGMGAGFLTNESTNLRKNKKKKFISSYLFSIGIDPGPGLCLL